MAVTWKGVFEITEDSGREVEIDAIGIAGGVEHYWGPYDGAVAFILSKTNHPEYAWLARKTGKVQREEGNFARITISYAGVPTATNQTTYRTSGATSSEPIETHPKWVTNIGGVPGEGGPVLDTKGEDTKKTYGKNGAVFDKDGKFVGFLKADNIKYGVKSYLAGSITYTETRVAGTLAGNNVMSDLGKISTPPPSAVLPTGIDAGRNYIMVSGTAEPVGAAGGKVDRTWKLSAFRGWDTDIYTE